MARKNKPGAGRPTVITPEVIRKLEEAASVNSTIRARWFHAQIKKSTYYDLMKARPEFSERLDDLTEGRGLQADLNITKRLKAGCIETSKWEKEHTDKRYVKQSSSDFTGKIETTDPATELLRNDIAGLNRAIDSEIAEIAKLRKIGKARPGKK